MSTAVAITRALKKYANQKRAQSSLRFFKTGKGQYGEGDTFIGVTVPQQRAVARQFYSLPPKDIEQLLASPIHEHRLTGLLILVRQFEQGTQEEQKKIYTFYIRHTDRVNNWDLVDVSAPQIVGAFLIGKGTSKLYQLVKSKNLWDRRIAIVATYAFIKQGFLESTLTLAKLLLNDQEDLIHKATGWMLREVGKQDQEVLEGFLNQQAHRMPRTMLRYAIERLPETKRRRYLGRDY